MVGSYGVRLGDSQVGTVTVERQGLYYRFFCRCSLSGQVMYRLWLLCEGGERDLGLCVPVDGGFGTERRLPVKQCAGTPEFVLRPNRAAPGTKFIPLSPEEPFRYLHRLENAYLARRGTELGIVIRE